MSPDILGPHAGLVVGARALQRPRERRNQHLFLAEGPQAVREALAAGLVRTLFVDHTRPAAMEEFGAEATALVTSRAIESLAETEAPQGVIAVCAMPSRTLVDTLQADTSFVVVCAGIGDPGNLGTIIRTADAAGADAVVVTAGSADVFNGKVIRSSAGSVFRIPVVQGVEPDEALDALEASGLTSLGLAGGESMTLFDIDDELLREPTAWWLGSEAHGLPRDLLSRMQGVSIPMPGDAESLNVAVAAGVAIFATVRARRS